MRVLVTGSSGHLGEGLVRRLRAQSHDVVSADIKPSPHTSNVGSIQDRAFVHRCMVGCEAVVHAATLHKPHLATHDRQAFVDVNVTGTLNLLEEARAGGVKSFVLASTTSTFGEALRPGPSEPAAWITEDVPPIPRNIYGATKLAAEHLCQVFHRSYELPCLVLRVSRFFPEPDDDEQTRETYADDNAKANEYLFRRVDLEDAVKAHILAIERAPELGFGRYIISATSPFERSDMVELRSEAPSVVSRYFPDFRQRYEACGWAMFPGIDRVYVNQRARAELGWAPEFDFGFVLRMLKENRDFRSPLARAVGSKGYHEGEFADGPYPVEA